MKIILNGIPCEADMNCTSPAGSFRFNSFEDYLRCFNRDETCGYCGRNFRPVIKETVNDKVACPDCREKLIPSMAVYFDKHRKVHDSRVSDRPISYAEYINKVMSQ